MRPSRPLLAMLLALAAWPAGAAAAAPPPDPALAGLPAKLAAAVAAGDAATVRAHCAGRGVVIDEFPPYLWSGANACGRWLAAFGAFAAQAKLTDIKATVKGPAFVDVSGSRAYVTATVRFDALMAGKPFADEGTWSFVLAKAGGAWKVTAMSWGTLHH